MTDKIIIHREEKDTKSVPIAASKDSRLSLKARGLYYTLLLLSESWKLTVQGLTKILPDGRDAIRSNIKLLETYGYCIREPIRDRKGKFLGYDYHIYESPLYASASELYIRKQEENPQPENPATGYPATGNPPQCIKEDIYNINTIQVQAEIDDWFDETEGNYIPEPSGPIQPKMFKEKTRKPQQMEVIPQTAHVALYGVCYLADTQQKALALDSTQRGRVAGALGRLRDAGADLGRIGDFETWWRNDWRSKVKESGAYQPPRPDQVVEHWFVAMENTKAQEPEKEELNGYERISSDELARTMQKIAQMRREGQ